jgi:putative transcriptional regulator
VKTLSHPAHAQSRDDTPKVLLRPAVLAPGLVLVALSPLVGLTDSPQDLARQLRPGAVKELAVGKLLVAARDVPDRRFAETVILLTEFDEQGAMGLIVNQRTEITLGRLLPNLAQPQAKATTVFLGGPVATDGILALLRSDAAPADGLHIVADVYLVGSRELLDDMFSGETGADRFRVYVGYAGWSPGQLDRETALGAWHVFDGDSDVVFDPDPGSVWSRQILRTETRVARR